MSIFSIRSFEQYQQAYDLSVQNPNQFWDEIAQHYTWFKPYHEVVQFSMEQAEFSWFGGGETNITYNCLDRHLANLAHKTAIIFEPNDPSEPHQEITYAELHHRVCEVANVLVKKGIRKGDRVCIYLPMIPELAISLLACARIGAIHSVVFAGFSAGALASRIEDCSCKMVITSDGGYRGNKIIDLKGIVDEALVSCPTVESVLVVQRTMQPIKIMEGRDFWLKNEILDIASDCSPEPMNSEDPLFILYTSGSTGKPKGMMHSTGGYMVYVGYTFQNVFQYQPTDTFWCTADIGWITGHSYILYGPLLNGATSVLFEGIPSYPDFGRFWSIIDKHQVTQFYTAPTAIRSLAKESLTWVEKYDLSSLKIIGSVGEPINDEAWQWYFEHIGKTNCPIVDTWWQTETGGILISPLPGITKLKPTFATLPLPGVQPVLINAEKELIHENESNGSLCIKYPWPAIARTIWGDHQRYKDTYFTAFPGYYFTGDGAIRDIDGYYRITGRVDDVIIVSGHNLGTAPIEDAINEHPFVAESAIVGFPHDIKGNALYGFVSLKEGMEIIDENQLRKEINQFVSDQIGPIAKLDKIQFTSSLPKTRSGKIMRRILRKIAEGDFSSFGDISTLLNPEIVDEIKKQAL
ncbi:MAG: acetate--CoA ligase [Crocinitomicaceae bacterium]|nr:acetate--CoA ligase [Crocinitomicaceae bacterium]MCF8411065.1 acetate--CoA ligase [Crocinitomicaceae bacterium]MCF8444556.1 acetate--CoA ligase [Crocinitomicaceae bacterium]